MEDNLNHVMVPDDVIGRWIGPHTTHWKKNTSQFDSNFEFSVCPKTDSQMWVSLTQLNNLLKNTSQIDSCFRVRLTHLDNFFNHISHIDSWSWVTLAQNSESCWLKIRSHAYSKSEVTLTRVSESCWLKIQSHADS